MKGKRIERDWTLATFRLDVLMMALFQLIHLAICIDFLVKTNSAARRHTPHPSTE